MNKVMHVAIREFIATVATKGFIIGMLVTPFIIMMLIIVMPKLLKFNAPNVVGEIAVLDPTGQVADSLREELTAEKIAGRRRATKKKIEEVTPPELKAMTESSPQGKLAMSQLDAALADVPTLSVVTLDPGTPVESAKDPLREKRAKAKSDQLGRFAVVVVHPDAVVRSDGKQSFGTYDMFVRGKVDDRITEEIEDAAREAIVGARVRSSGLDRELVTAVTKVGRIQSVTVTSEGEAKTNQFLNIMLPAGFMALLLISVLTSGSLLLTTTVEEKSNRVVEVLLSAVSPMQLMVGKILGQMAVGFVVLGLYCALGITALVSFAMVGLLDPKMLFFLVIFYILTYTTIASLMAAVGAAVNEMREAQNLNLPIMMLIMIPWMLWMPISRDPNSTFATTLSFIPPVGNMVMMLRMTSSTPPPMWQVWLSIAVSALGVYAAVWFAAKVFRIGLLMFGKPPSFATLIKWARMS